MRNAAYTDAYRQVRAREEAVIRPETLASEKERILPYGYRLQTQEYIEHFPEHRRMLASAHRLLDESGQLVYAYNNFPYGGIADFVDHANGHRYFLHQIDLYGYSVLDMGTMDVFHYVPCASMDQAHPDFEETFIWTDVHYCEANSLLVAEGCYWACPASLVITDFANPMIAMPWAEIIGDCHGDYDDYVFVAWRDGQLSYKKEFEDEELTLSEAECRAMIAKGQAGW